MVFPSDSMEKLKQEQLNTRAAQIINEIGPSIERALINEICYRELGATVTNDRLPFRN
jgi:hypothetical protein